MFGDFVKFLKEFNIAALAIGFVMGSASTALVKSLVADVIMPIFEPVLPGDSWKEAALSLGQVKIAYGSFVAELLSFVILAFVVYIIAKKLLKMEAVPKK